jgi:hypothetical protein
MERSAPAPPTVRKAIEFYTVELARLVDGKLSVSITGTTVDEEEPQLLNQEIASRCVPNLDNALAVIKEAVERTSRAI